MVRRRGAGGSGDHGEAAAVVPGGDGVHYGVQLEMVITMVCRAEILASCIDEGKRPELAGALATCRASMGFGVAEGSGRWGSYQELQEVKAELVAKFECSRKSGSAGIPRRSYVWRLRDPVEDVPVVLVKEEGRKLVRGLRQNTVKK
jgi:hypothetical protein